MNCGKPGGNLMYKMPSMEAADERGDSTTYGKDCGAKTLYEANDFRFQPSQNPAWLAQSKI